MTRSVAFAYHTIIEDHRELCATSRVAISSSIVWAPRGGGWSWECWNAVREAAVLTAGEGDVTAQRLISSQQLMLSYSYARALTERSRSYRTSHRGWVPEHARQDVDEASTEAHADPACGGHRRNWLKRGLGERNSHPLATYSESRRTVRPSTARDKVRAVRPHMGCKR